MLSNDRICGPTCSGKALHLSNQSFLCKISSQNKAWCCDTWQFLSPVSSVYTRNAWEHEPLSAQTHSKNKKHLHFLSLAAKAKETNNDVNTTISGVSSHLSSCLSKCSSSCLKWHYSLLSALRNDLYRH